jgi:hypothetical protein
MSAYIQWHEPSGPSFSLAKAGLVDRGRACPRRVPIPAALAIKGYLRPESCLLSPPAKPVKGSPAIPARVRDEHRYQVRHPRRTGPRFKADSGCDTRPAVLGIRLRGWRFSKGGRSWRRIPRELDHRRRQALYLREAPSDRSSSAKDVAGQHGARAEATARSCLPPVGGTRGSPALRSTPRAAPRGCVWVAQLAAEGAGSKVGSGAARLGHLGRIVHRPAAHRPRRDHRGRIGAVPPRRFISSCSTARS